MEQMSLKDVAALLGVKAYRVEYLLAHGLVPEPKLRVSGRRVFTASDLETLRKHFSSKTPATARSLRKQPQAYSKTRGRARIPGLNESILAGGGNDSKQISVNKKQVTTMVSLANRTTNNNTPSTPRSVDARSDRQCLATGSHTAGTMDAGAARQPHRRLRLVLALGQPSMPGKSNNYTAPANKDLRGQAL